ncbi:MAG: hypothetical protein PVI06_17715 [Desulfobacterales bacterium]|jgi:hypothetical protein
MTRKMVTLFAGFILIASSISAYGLSMRAKTEDGRTVILNADGTWKFAEKKDVAKKAFGKPPGANKTVSDPRGFVELWYTPSKWIVYPKPERLSPDASFALIHQTKDAYVIGIVERISMPLETLKSIAVENAKNVAADAKVVLDEERQINGVNAAVMDIEGTIDGIPFRYHSYYWTGKEGSIQVITYTSQNLFQEYHADFDELLSGIVLNR